MAEVNGSEDNGCYKQLEKGQGSTKALSLVPLMAIHFAMSLRQSANENPAEQSPQMDEAARTFIRHGLGSPG
ncbi:MAG: hypothetical protein ABI072_02650 [Edaphobacter sp.]